MKNKVLKMSFGLGVLAVAAISPSIANAQGKFATTTANLNFRKGPSTSQPVIITIKKDSKVEVLSTSDGWAKVKYNNTIGYCSTSYLKMIESNVENVVTGTVTASPRLNIRSGAGTAYSVVDKAEYGSKVTIVSSKTGWHRVKLSNGKFGWASADYIKVDSTSSDSNTGNGGTENPGDNENNSGALPTPTNTPVYVDAPYNSLVMDSAYDSYQEMIDLYTEGNGAVTGIELTTEENFGIEYSTYGNGKWVTVQDGQVASNSGAKIEGVKISLKNAPEDYHIFYRVKVAGYGWQNWVKDGKISGEVRNGRHIEAIEARLVVSNNTDAMEKPTIAVDLGHNVNRPTTFGAVNGIYEEDYLIREVGKKVVYKLRSMGYNVVETKPNGNYSQSAELSERAKTANANEADRFVSVHFNSGPKGANGTEVYYSSKGGSKDMATRMSRNISNDFGFKNRGAKDGNHLYVLKNTSMPAVLVEGCFLDQIDMNKIIAKGSSAYEVMAQGIVDGIF